MPDTDLATRIRAAVERLLEQHELSLTCVAADAMRESETNQQAYALVIEAVMLEVERG